MSSARRTPNGGFAPRASADGSHHTTEYPPAASSGPRAPSSPTASNTGGPGRTAPAPAGSSFGRRSTESVALKGGHFGPGLASRRGASGGYSASFNGPSQPSCHGASPTAGTTSRSRARVAAT